MFQYSIDLSNRYPQMTPLAPPSGSSGAAIAQQVNHVANTSHAEVPESLLLTPRQNSPLKTQIVDFLTRFRKCIICGNKDQTKQPEEREMLPIAKRRRTEESSISTHSPLSNPPSDPSRKPKSSNPPSSGRKLRSTAAEIHQRNTTKPSTSTSGLNKETHRASHIRAKYKSHATSAPKKKKWKNSEIYLKSGIRVYILNEELQNILFTAKMSTLRMNTMKLTGDPLASAYFEPNTSRRHLEMMDALEGFIKDYRDNIESPASLRRHVSDADLRDMLKLY